jgi:hypothetical protein
MDVGMFLDMGFGIIVLGPPLAPADRVRKSHDRARYTVLRAGPFRNLWNSRVIPARSELFDLAILMAEMFALLLVTYIPFFTLYFPTILGYVR